MYKVEVRNCLQTLSWQAAVPVMLEDVYPALCL
jgi:hypothetical protein